MNQYITRAYNKFEIDEQRGILTKLSKETRLDDEINFYKDIKDLPVSIWFPRFLENEITNGYSMKLEYYAYRNLGDLMVYSTKFAEDIWKKVISGIKTSLNDFTSYRKFNGRFEADQRQMYIEKTLNYYYELIGKFKKLRHIANHKMLKINGAEYFNFDEIWPNIEKLIEKHLIKNNFEPSMIHGDFCFSNIMFGETKTGDLILKYVDPRGSFGTKGIFGDPLYDIAKLRHSFEGGYEYIIYDKFNLLEGNLQDFREFNFSFQNDYRQEITKLFNQDPIFGDPKAKLIEGLIFIGMCSRHYDSLDRQVIMYLTGVKILNEVLTELE